MIQFNDDLEKLGADVVDRFREGKFSTLTELIESGKIRIAFLESTKSKRQKMKIVYGDCQKCNEKQKLLSGYDFAITFYADAMVLPDEKKEILMEHELMHIGIDLDDPKRRFVVPHDLSDFEDIVKKYGVDWVENGSAPKREEMP